MRSLFELDPSKISQMVGIPGNYTPRQQNNGKVSNDLKTKDTKIRKFGRKQTWGMLLGSSMRSFTDVARLKSCQK